MEYKALTGLVKSIKKAFWYFAIFVTYVYFANPELLTQLLGDWFGVAGAGLAMTLLGLVINFVKHATNIELPGFLEGNK